MARRRRGRLRRDSYYHDGDLLFAENTLYLEPNRIKENRFVSRLKNRIDLFSEDHIVVELRKRFHHVSIHKVAKRANNSAIKTGKYKKAISR